MLALVFISALFLGGLELPDDEARQVVAGAGLLGAVLGALMAWGCRDTTAGTDTL
jgi:cyanate lyase